MCSIIDANAVHEVFGSDKKSATEAGEGFFRWLNSGKCKLVMGGKLKQEFQQGAPKFHLWAREAIRAGILVNINDNHVNEKTKIIANCDYLRSDDPHIIALAQVTGARLLFSNDKHLQKDFKNPDFINKPRGKIYSTIGNKSFTPEKRELLNGHRCRSHG